MFKKFKKKHIIYAFLLIGIFSLFMFSTIVYSAINGTIKISGNAYARAEADVRITDFRLASSNNATSSYEEFGKNHVVTDVEFINSSSSISYYVEVSNYGTNSVGIYEITGLPSEVSYTIEGYNLKDKICDNSNVCSGFFKQTYKITLNSTSSYAGSIKLDFDIRPFLNISYVNLTGDYKKEFLAGDFVNIDISEEYPEFAYAIGEEEFEYVYEYGVIHFSDVYCDVEIGAIVTKDYSYTGDVQSYKVKADGIYKIELWGASGGKDMLQGILYDNSTGLGGFTSGVIELKKDENLYFYVGGKGEDGILRGNAKGGYNGGGSASHDADDEASGAGGGATDVRLVSGVWNDGLSLKSRIMVAGAGASERVWKPASGVLKKYVSPYCAGGGLIGYTIVSTSSPGTQTTGYAFGYGESGNTSSLDTGDGGSDSGLNGGGGGYYGGTSGNTSYYDIAAGGSSFISGHNGCVAIKNADSLLPRYDSLGSQCADGTNDIMCSYHYSGKRFYNTIMIDGAGYNWTTAKEEYIGMPTISGNGIMTGNSGDGYAKITPLGLGDYNFVKFKNIDADLSDYSYVKNGNDLIVPFVGDYGGVYVKKADGSDFNNYTFDNVNKVLTLNNVNSDIEVSFFSKFEASVAYETGGDYCLRLYHSFDKLDNIHYPIKIDYYRKYSSDDEYDLIDSYELTRDDAGEYFYGDCSTDAYESYDVRIVYTANTGQVITIEDTVGTECFVAGTKVLVENGYKNIEELQVGDYVYALDLNTNERVLRPIVRKFEGFTNETFEITVNGEKIVATPKHKFYVVDKGWIRACELQVGDILSNMNQNYPITNIKQVRHDKPVMVYNLTVDELHNYFITEDQVFVHNFASAHPD